MNLYSVLSKIIQAFTSEYLIFIVIFGLFYFYDRYIVARASYLLLFNMILNKVLKYQFGVALPPEVNSTEFAFPSGHMQTSSVFWLYLGWQTQERLYKILSFLLCVLIGANLIYLKYQDIYDVLGGFSFAVLSIFIFNNLMYSSFFAKKEYYLSTYFFIISLALLYFIVKTSKNYPYLWGNIGSFLGYTIGFYSREKKKIDQIYWDFKIPWKFSAAILFIGAVSIYSTASLLNMIPYIKQGFNHFMKFLWLSYWLVYGVDLYINKLIEKIREQQTNNQK